MKIENIKNLKELKVVNSYLKPSKVFIPLVSQNDKNITLLVKKGDYVFKGSIIGKSKGNLRIPIISSVSGTVIGFSEHTYLSGEKVKCVEIENDYKDTLEKKTGTKRVLNKYTKDEFIEVLRNCGVVGSYSGFPTYLKYEKNVNTLIINAVSDEPYVKCDYALLKEKCEEILEAIDATMDICDIDECFIAVKIDDYDTKKILNNYIGTYLKIKIVEVPNDYPMGWEKNLIKNIKSLKQEKSIIVNNVSTMYSIYEALKYNRPLTQRIITISGDALSKPQNVIVKNGTLIKEVIDYIGGLKKCNEIKFIAGGPMMGKSLPSDDLVVTPDLKSVMVFKCSKKDVKSNCIMCGKCVNACPVKLSPAVIMKNIKNEKVLEKLNVNKCIECGICSYICPSKINVRKYVEDAKEILGVKK